MANTLVRDLRLVEGKHCEVVESLEGDAPRVGDLRVGEIQYLELCQVGGLARVPGPLSSNCVLFKLNIRSCTAPKCFRPLPVIAVSSGKGVCNFVSRPNGTTRRR